MNTPFLPEALQHHWIGPVREHTPQADHRGAWCNFAARLRAHSSVDAARVSTMQQIIVSGHYVFAARLRVHSSVDAARVSTMQQIIVSGHYVCNSGAVANAVLASLDLPRRH